MSGGATDGLRFRWDAPFELFEDCAQRLAFYGVGTKDEQINRTPQHFLESLERFTWSRRVVEVRAAYGK